MIGSTDPHQDSGEFRDDVDSVGLKRMKITRTVEETESFRQSLALRTDFILRRVIRESPNRRGRETAWTVARLILWAVQGLLIPAGENPVRQRVVGHSLGRQPHRSLLQEKPPWEVSEHAGHGPE